MIFHISAQHDHTTCLRVLEGNDAMRERQSWLEGTESVNVIGAWAYPVSHRQFAVVEAETFADVASLFEFHLGMGPVEVLPVHDSVQRRKEMGHWGSH